MTKKCNRIIRCIKAGEGGSVNDKTHPSGDSQVNVGCKILNRVPSAAKPVRRITKKRNNGIKGFLCSLSPVLRLRRKNKVPASSAMPKRSANRDNNRAGMIGIVKPSWARMMTIICTVNPQKSMRWALPGLGFFRIFACPRIYLKRPVQSPERFSSRPIRQTDRRLEKPTIIKMKAKAMRSRSKADIKIPPGL